MFKFLGLFLIFSLGMNTQSFAADLDAKEIRDRLNKIFYWQLSDELKLSPAQEKAVVSILESSQKKRDAALEQRESSMKALQALPKTATLAQSKPHLDAYASALETLSRSEHEEHLALKAAMGEELLARFYIIREDVTSRVRKALRK